MTIKVELTRSPGLLQQYYALRQQCFREDLGISDFDGSESMRDRLGHILLAHEDGRCIGGVRISSELEVSNIISDLDLHENACCMWERFVIDPTFRSLKFTRHFIAHLIKTSDTLGFHHGIVLSSLRNARFYKACHTALGVTFEIDRHLPDYGADDFAGLEHYLSISHLREPVRLHLVA